MYIEGLLSLVWLFKTGAYQEFVRSLKLETVIVILSFTILWFYFKIMHYFVCLKILQIEDLGCFWVIIKGNSPLLDHEADYQKLNSAMNDFYNSMRQDIKIKPLMLEEGQVCI